MKQQVYIDGQDIYEMYGVLFLKGAYNSIMQPPKRKESLTNNWRELNGEETDLEMARYEAKDITIPCGLIADNGVDFKGKYDTFFELLMGDGLREITISELDFDFEAYYLETSGYTQITRLKEINKVAAKFTIKMRVTDPIFDFSITLITEDEFDLITEDEFDIIV